MEQTMAKQIEQSEFEIIRQALAAFPEGVHLREIKKFSQNALPDHTLQRRLNQLIEAEEVFREGKGRATKYKLLIRKGEDTVPLSAAAMEVQAKVRLPMYTRPPTGYNRRFLEQYRPNVTPYLSEAMQKKLYDMGKTNGELPAGTYARQMFNRLLIDLSWNSSRLEGNTYSLLETERLLKLGEIADAKSFLEARMLLNHKEAIEFLIEQGEDLQINRYTILNLHAILSNELLADINASGRLRTISIGIGKSVYQPLSIPQVISECFQQILESASAINNPLEQAFFLMVHLPYLQPFDDVNKRVSRLAANIPLILHNLCPLSFIDAPHKEYVEGLLGVYELNRVELLRDVFMWAYERSCLRYSNTRKELGEPDHFRIRYRNLITEAVTVIVRGKMNKKEAIKIIRQQAHLSVPVEDQARFIEEVEIDLMSLHEGNIGRHRLRLSEYQEWLLYWE
jgi:Fic family protein